MQYCTKCVMPSTRPGITFDQNGVCSACQSYERRKTIDWESAGTSWRHCAINTAE